MLRARQRLGKYRIRAHVARGGFADVYRANDTVEGIDVALKVPRTLQLKPQDEADFRKEVKLAGRLDHPNILRLKNADEIDGRLVMAYPLGEESLADRIERRASARLLLRWGEELLDALAHAHEHRVVHCDVKPGNLILFDDGSLRLTDFGIAKIAARTVMASGSGTVGYIAPEQALGQPSMRSDVFSAGLVLYRMFTGQLPRWPFEWPCDGAERLRRYGSEMEAVVRRAIAVDARKRFRDAGAMLGAYRRAKTAAARKMRGRAVSRGAAVGTRTTRDWKSIRMRQFRRRFGKAFDLRRRCNHCSHPVDERMVACPWCGTNPLVCLDETAFPATCDRCERGVKLDWVYCGWCYGGKIGPQSERNYPDRRYTAGCGRCGEKVLPFSRYCPWCRAKVRKTWKVEGAKPCRGCGGPNAGDFWTYCAWCGRES